MTLTSRYKNQFRRHRVEKQEQTTAEDGVTNI